MKKKQWKKFGMKKKKPVSTYPSQVAQMDLKGVEKVLIYVAMLRDYRNGYILI